MSTNDTSETDAQNENRDGTASIVDTSRYAPVRMESIDTPGATTEAEKPTAIGGRCLKARDFGDSDEKEVEIPHHNIDHILAAGLPRSGKDSLIASIGKNLKEEHGYSYVSIHDDGRMETPMLAVPNDENRMRDALEDFGQTPEGMATEVFVPATDGLSERLPANFTPFTIGLDSLTPQICRHFLTDGDDGYDDLDAQIHRALTDTLQSPGHDPVDEFTSRLRKNHSALEGVADVLDRLADAGVLAAPDAETNIDMESVIADQERAAVLCCNFLGDGQHDLKYRIEDLWLQLVYEARDTNPRLPRVCLEIRELKNVAPSKLSGVRYPDAIKGLRTTVTNLSERGGSRRILMLGSTQKLADVYKPVRTNMPTKLLLRFGKEDMRTLARTHDFSEKQHEHFERHLTSLDIGEGVLFTSDEVVGPIEFRPTPTGLGLGDQHWRDRYGKAWGARVRMHEAEDFDADWWVSTADATVYESDGPEIDEWYLLAEDFPEGTTPEDVDADLVADALEARRAEGVQSDLSLQPIHADATPLPEALSDWADASEQARRRMVEACRAIQQGDDIRTTADIADRVSFSESTLRNYTNGLLSPCIEKNDTYTLTAVGEQAARLDL